MMKAAAAAAAPTADLITPFIDGEYNSKFITEPLALERLLAIADTIHDFGAGYRKKPSSEGKSEILRFLIGNARLQGYIQQFLGAAAPNPYQSILINGYNNIEATNREYFENQTGVDWITPITEKVKMEDIVSGANNEVFLATSYRDNNISIELVPPTNNYINSLDEAGLTKLRNFIITFLFEYPDGECYFASDAQPKSVGKILKGSTTAKGIVFPQTISDSAPTALDGKLTQLVDHYYFPCDNPGGLVFTSRANTFTQGVFTVAYQNGSDRGKDSFSLDTPYAWKQVINVNKSTPYATIQYSATGGKEGPSLDQLLELQVKTRNSPAAPKVTPATTRQIRLSDVTGFSSIYPEIKAGIDVNTHSLYLDLKRSGDQDQCLAVSYARRDLSPNVALITGDITCAVKNRSYDNPTIEHYNDRIRLYRSSKTAKPLSADQVARLKYNTLRARAEKLEPIMKLFCAPAERGKIRGYIETIAAAIRGKDATKADDISGYIRLLTEVSDECVPAIIPLPGPVNVPTMSVADLTTPNSVLEALVESYEKNLTRIQNEIQAAINTPAAAAAGAGVAATASPDYSAPSVEFLNWFATNCMNGFVPSGAIPELNYDPTLIIPDDLPNFLTASYPAPIDIISEIDKYNSITIKYCNMLFSASLKERLLNEKMYKFEATGGSSDEVEKMRTILTKLYHISLKTNLRLHGLAAPVVYDLFWRTAGAVLSYVQRNGVNAFTAASANIKNDLGIIISNINTNLHETPTAIDYILEGIGTGAISSRAAAGTGARVRFRRAVPAAAVSAGTVNPSTIGVGSKRKRGAIGGRRITLRRQRGGAACITKVDIVDELMDFFGYVAADFRTIVYEKFPELALYIRALSLKASKSDTVEHTLELADIIRIVKHNGMDIILEPWTIDVLIKYLKDNYVILYTIQDCLATVTDALSDTTVASNKRQEYIELFKTTVVDVFNSKWITNTDCGDYTNLIKYIWLLLTGEDKLVVGQDDKIISGRPMFSIAVFIIIISYIYDILMLKDKTYKSLVKELNPTLFGKSEKSYNYYAGGDIDIVSNKGVSNIINFITYYIPTAATTALAAKRARKDVAAGAGDDGDAGGNGYDTNDNLGGGAYPPHRRRRTHRRYSAQQYRKHTKTARRRRRR
jgi:hypothetical protein